MDDFDPPASTASAGITGVSHYLQISQVLCISACLFHSLRAYLAERGGSHAPKQVVDREIVPTQLQVWHRCLQDDAKTAARAEALEFRRTAGLEAIPTAVANEPQRSVI